jgi:hypothetical protein
MSAPSSKCANRRDFFCTGQTLCPHRAGGIGAPVGAPHAPTRNVLLLPRKQGFFVAESPAVWPSAEGKKGELVARLDEHRRKCPNAVAGCKESVLRKDAARHAVGWRVQPQVRALPAAAISASTHCGKRGVGARAASRPLWG